MAPETPPERPRLQFGPFEFDQGLGELYRDGQRIRLQEKPRQLLAALLARPGEIATREALREQLWGSETFVDFEHGLNTAIKKVRQALGDSAESPAFIETLSRRGYRFIAPIRTVAVAPPVEGAPQSGAPSAAETRRRPLWGAVVLLVTVIAVIGALVWAGRRRTHPEGAPPAIQGATAQLAVLPLRVLTGPGSGESSYMGTAIADAITTRLANLHQIGLRPTAAVLPFKDAQSDPARVAGILGVHYLLVGTIQPVDNAYRFSVQLVRADGVAVWGRTFDEPRGGLLGVQDHIAEQVADALRVELSPPERARLHVRYTQNPAAYDLYMRGRALLVNYTEAKMRDAIGYFEKALAVDQDYALARAALATGAAWFSVRYAYEADALAWGKRADQEARRALGQDPSLADAHLAIASAAGTLYGGFNWKAVLESSSAALTLDPSLDLAHVVRMRAFYHLGLFARTREEAQRARVLNPSPSVELSRLEIASQLFNGDYAAAADHAAALLKDTDAPAVRQYLALARFYNGDVAGAREMLGSLSRGGKPDVRAQASLASIEAASGMRDQARTRADGIAHGSYMDHHVAYSLGAAYAQLGQPGEAMVWLRRAVDTGFPCYPWFERDRLLDPLRRQPEFMRLLADMRKMFETWDGR